MAKQSLPSGWKSLKLGKLFDERSEANCAELELLSVTATRGIIPRSEIEGKDNSNEDKSKYLKVCKGDIAYNTMRMWQGVSALSDYEGIVSPAYTVLAPKDDVCAKYFAYLFKLPHTVFNFYRYSQGIVDDQRSLKYRNFIRVTANIPPLAEQRAIAEILTTTDRLIALKERLIAAKRKQKRWLMSQLLTGKLRLPGFSGAWESVRLGEMYHIYSGQTPYRGDPANYENSTTAWVKTTDLNNSSVVSNEESISDKAAKKMKTLPVGTVLIAMYGGFNQIGRTGMLSYPATINQAISALPPINEVNPYFLISVLNIRVGYWRRIAASSRKDPNITKKDVASFILHYPTLPEQQAIAAVLTAADREIELLTREMEQERQIKEYLMQQLLTGKIRTKGATV